MDQQTSTHIWKWRRLAVYSELGIFNYSSFNLCDHHHRCVIPLLVFTWTFFFFSSKSSTSLFVFNHHPFSNTSSTIYSNAAQDSSSLINYATLSDLYVSITYLHHYLNYHFLLLSHHTLSYNVSSFFLTVSHCWSHRLFDRPFLVSVLPSPSTLVFCLLCSHFMQYCQLSIVSSSLPLCVL